jgi:hypothetical protein
MAGFLTYAIRTIFAVVLILLAVAVVGKAFAYSRTTVDEASLSSSSAQEPCAAFDAWFLDPACHNKGHAKKAAHGKHRQAHLAIR